MWVGATRDVDAVFVWRWSNNNTLSYYAWDSGQPNGDPHNMDAGNPSLHQDCLIMKQSGLFHDGECSRKHAYLCSKGNGASRRFYLSAIQGFFLMFSSTNTHTQISDSES